MIIRPIRPIREILDAIEEKENFLKFLKNKSTKIGYPTSIKSNRLDLHSYFSDSGVVMTGITALSYYGYCSGRSNYVEARSDLFEGTINKSINDFTIYINSGIKEESIELDGGTLYVDLFTAFYEAILCLSDDSAITQAIIDMRNDKTLDKFLDWASEKEGIDMDLINKTIEEYSHSDYWE